MFTRKKFEGALQVGKHLVHIDLTRELFTCDIGACKGACCVAGELGAPLEKDERKILDEIVDDVLPYLPEAGQRAIAEQGAWVRDFAGGNSTPLVAGRECAYTVFDETGVAKCGIELAHTDGAVPFRKPISCHLYPIRVTKTRRGAILNYHRWNICSPACALGERTGLRVYQFLREPLIRAFGEGFYEELDAIVNALEAQNAAGSDD